MCAVGHFPMTPEEPGRVAASLNFQHTQGTGSILSQDLNSLAVHGERPESGQQFGNGLQGRDGL